MRTAAPVPHIIDFFFSFLYYLPFKPSCLGNNRCLCCFFAIRTPGYNVLNILRFRAGLTAEERRSLSTVNDAIPGVFLKMILRADSTSIGYTREEEAKCVLPVTQSRVLQDTLF